MYIKSEIRCHWVHHLERWRTKCSCLVKVALHVLRDESDSKGCRVCRSARALAAADCIDNGAAYQARHSCLSGSSNSRKWRSRPSLLMRHGWDTFRRTFSWVFRQGQIHIHQHSAVPWHKACASQLKQMRANRFVFRAMVWRARIPEINPRVPRLNPNPSRRKTQSVSSINISSLTK